MSLANKVKEVLKVVLSIVFLILIIGLLASTCAEPIAKVCKPIKIISINTLPTSFNEEVKTEIFVENSRYLVTTVTSFDYETEICDDKYIRARNGRLYTIR